MKEVNNGGAFLLSIRQQSGRSMREVGDSVEPPILSGHLSQIERGVVKYPSIDLLERLALAYRVSPVELMDAYGLPVAAHELEIAKALTIGKQVLASDEGGQRQVLSFIGFQQSKMQARG